MIHATQDITYAKKLSQDLHPSVVEQGTSPYLLNGDIQDVNTDGNGLFVQNLPGNISCVDVGPNYLGFVKLDKNQFLIINSPGLVRLVDGDTCSVSTIVSADCLNFRNPIKGRYQYVQDTRRAYIIEKDGPIRFIDVETCQPRTRTNTCEQFEDDYTDTFDCESTLLNQKVLYPCISLSSDTTGNIPNGSYQVAIAYHLDGQRYSEYIILPEIIRLHSRTNRFSIIVNIEPCIPLGFDNYELVLITHRTDRATSAQSIGVFDSSQTSIVISTLDEPSYQPIERNVLLEAHVKYESADHIAVNDETLVLAGLTTKKVLEYQEQANDIEAEWVSMAVPLKDAHEYPSFMSGEVYAFYIDWVYPDGSTSLKYLISSKAEDADRLTVAPDSDNHWENSDECEPRPLYLWEVEDNSTVTVVNATPDPTCGPVEVAYGTFTYWESANELYPSTFGDLAGLPIRHHKFPKNSTHHPYTHTHLDGDCEDPIVLIKTVRFKNITPPLDCDGNPAKIQGYRIYVADRTGQETILAKGMLYNVREETLPNGETSMFQNYPFNDLNPDVFLGDRKITQGSVLSYQPLENYYQDRFTMISPDNQYIKNKIGSELEIYTNEYGPIDGLFHETGSYPKYQLLSPFARLTSQTVGLLEAREVLLGKPCTSSTVEKVCKKLKARTSTTDGYVIAENDVSGGALVNTLTTGTGNINTRITTTFTAQNADYSWTTEGDDDCSTGYILSSLTVTNLSSNPLEVPVLTNSTCRLEVNTNAPAGVILTITLNDTIYQITLDDDGKGSLNLNNDCEPFSPLGFGSWNAGNVSHSFSPECVCTGDTETRTTSTTSTCETKIKWLEDKDWFQRFPAMLHYYTQGTKAVQDFLQAVTSPSAYAVQYSAVANYTNSTPAFNRRRIDFQQYLIPQRVKVNGRRFNNWQQASADYLEIHEPIADPANEDFSRILITDNNCNKEFSCAIIDGKPVQASSYYGAIKRRLPNQYGGIGDHLIKQISCVLNSSTTEPLFGGDIYITRHYTLRRMPFYTSLPLNLPNNTEFDVDQYFNIAKTRFWLNVNNESAIEDAIEDIPLVGNYFYDFNLDLHQGWDNCGAGDLANILAATGGPGYLIAWLASLPSGWTNPFKLPGKFYTHVTGVSSYICESKFIGNYREYSEIPVSKTVEDENITELANPLYFGLPELFQYNLHYHWGGETKQGFFYKKQLCCDPTIDRFSLIYSLKQNTSSRTDQWLKFLPLNYTELPRHTGNLTVLKEIDEYRLFIGFEDASYVTQADEGLLTSDFRQVFTGTADAFSRRLRRLSDDSTGYGGIIDETAITSTKYGVFWYDRKRKAFIQFTNNIKDVTGSMRSWFQNYLDEPVTLEFDAYSDNVYILAKDRGLTYKPILEGFVSYLDWGVDGFLQMSNNYLTLKDGRLWKHNQKFYQRMFDKDQKFEVGMLLKDKMGQYNLQSIDIYAEFYELLNTDKYYKTNVFFDKMLIFNQLYSSGLTDLYLRNENDERSVALQNRVTEVSKVEDFVYRMNNLFIRSNQQPIYRNIDGVRYELGENNLNEIRQLTGKYFQLRLIKEAGPEKVLVSLAAAINSIKTTP